MSDPMPKLRRTALWTAAAASLGLVAAGLGAEAPRGWLLEAAGTVGAHLARSTALPNWAVYLLSACAAACAWQFRRRPTMGTRRRTRTPQPSDYQSDRFLGVCWSWHWDEHQRPKGLWAACPSCDTRLVSYIAKPPAERRVKMFCEHCRLTLVDQPGDRDYLHARIARQIERQLRTGAWLDSGHRDTLGAAGPATMTPTPPIDRPLAPLPERRAA